MAGQLINIVSKDDCKTVHEPPKEALKIDSSSKIQYQGFQKVEQRHNDRSLTHEPPPPSYDSSAELKIQRLEESKWTKPRAEIIVEEIPLKQDD